MSTLIYLVRHTQTTGNIEKRLAGRTDFEITPDGEKYVNLLTDNLKHIKFDAAYSSTSKRTFKTIQKLAAFNNIEIIENERLCEMSFGVYDGMKWDEVNNINNQIEILHKATNEIMSIPGQESSLEVANRMYNCILEIAKSHKNQNILICSHGVAIEAFLRKITGVPFKQEIDKYSQRNTSINILEFDETFNKFKVIEINNYKHIL